MLYVYIYNNLFNLYRMVSTYVDIDIYILRYRYLHFYPYFYVRVHIYIYVYTCVRVFVYIHTHAYIYIYIYIYIRILIYTDRSIDRSVDFIKIINKHGQYDFVSPNITKLDYPVPWLFLSLTCGLGI